MSRQCDLLESMALCIIGRMGSGQTQKTVANTVREAISIIANDMYSLTAIYPAARTKWIAGHRGCMQSDWSQVLFTSESGFSLESDTRLVLVWRESGT
ncbi:hypothetical protein TNCV_1973071 [Trichonephila clavipes]|nr:hypothetical protein TNCV_1973071 [Trichonephila clavipes]